MLLTSRFAALFFAVFLLAVSAKSQTTVSGPQSGTWSKQGSPYLISGSVTVEEGKTLTIQAGVIVRSENFSDKLLVNGTLMAKGTEASPIRFAGFPIAGFPLSSHGGSLVFSSTASNSVLEYVSIDQMGDNQYANGAVSVSTSSLTVSHCTITNSEAAGIYIDGFSKPIVKDNSFTKDLVAISGSANNFNQVTNNTLARIKIRNEPVGSNSALPAQASGSYYVLEAGGFSVNAQNMLEIKAGVEVRSENFSDKIIINGTLVAKGTEASPIRFTGFPIEGFPLASHGGSLVFSSTSSNSILDYVSIDQMGDNQYANGAVSVSTSSISITHCKITNSEAAGLYIDGFSKPTVKDNSFTKDLVAISGSANNFNQVTNNTLARIKIRNEPVGSNSALPAQASGSYYVLEAGGFSVNAQNMLEIKAGVEVRSENFSDKIIINGTLMAKGTEASPIRFIGFPIEGFPLASHGGSLVFSNTSSNSILEYVSIDRMGDNQYANGALTISSPSVSINYCSILNSEGNGIYNDASSLKISNTNLYNNQVGLYNANGAVLLVDCKIYNNTDYGINNIGTELVDAKNNYWGELSGPLHTETNTPGKGNRVSDKVLYAPWKQQLIQLEQSITMAVIPEQHTGGKLKLSATSSSGLPVTYQISSIPKTGVALLRDDVISFLGDTGTVTLTVSQAGNASFKAVELKRSFKVLSKILSIALSSKQITEGSAEGITVTVARNAALTDELALTVKVGDGKRLSVPASVTIPAGQGAVTFKVSVPDNGQVEGNLIDSISISAAGYQGAVANLTILDNEVPALSIADLPAEIMEGNTVVFHIKTNLIPEKPLTVFLRSGNPARFPLPASVVIPKGASSIAVSVTLDQDEIPEIDLPLTLSAGAANHQSVTAEIKVMDDDLPDLELVIHTGLISESAGPYAAKATLKRKSQDHKTAFTVNLSTDISDQLILPASISLAEGENEKTFDIGVKDNDQVDGSRIVTLSANMFVASCGCNTLPASSGSVSAKITISDNDGPSLQVSAAQQTLAEGLANAGTLRISRNTPTNVALTITLTSSDANEATVPASIVMPVGQSFVDVAINTKNDGIEDGSKQVYFQASANGFSTGTNWVIVTDLNKPDLQIASVKVNKASVQALTIFNYEIGIKNSGFATAPGGVVVKGYLSKDDTIDAADILIAEDVVEGPIAAGETKAVLNAVKAPEGAGDYKLLFQVNPDGKLTELLHTNNVSEALNLSVTAKYTAKAAVAQEYFLKGATVPIKGSATNGDGTVAANEKVDVYVIVNGIKRIIPANTDANGQFSVDFQPLANEAGHYSVGACYPGLGLSATQDAFDILGVRINEGNAPQFLVKLGATESGKIKVENVSNKDLSNLTLTAIKLPNGGLVTFSPVALLKGNASVEVPYTLKGNALSSGDNYEEISLQVKSTEGAIQTTDAYYYCQSPNANVVANVELLDVTASQTKGEREVTFKLINKGQGATGKLQISLPDVKWITALSGKTVASLGAGDTAIVVLKFLAAAEIPFDYPIKGNIGIAAQNGNSFALPFSFKKVSDAAGIVKVTATDQFTYYTEGGPNVKDAHVQIKNAFTGQVYAEGNTDANGVFTAANVPEGRHRIIVKKEKHADYNGDVEVNPGGQVDVSAFLNYQAVTFDWKVVPTGIQDNYEVTLETKFETDVPKPVVTIDMPKVLPKLTGDETFSFNITLVNHGLITAEKVALSMPTTDPEYEFVMDYEPTNINAHQSIQIPVILRLRTGLNPAARFTTMSMKLAKESADDTPVFCWGVASITYWYKCNKQTGLWENMAFSFKYPRLCDSPGGGGSPSGGGGGGGGLSAADLALIDWWMQWMNGWGEGLKNVPCLTCGPVDYSSWKPVPPPIVTPKKHCKACTDAMDDMLKDLAVDLAKEGALIGLQIAGGAGGPALRKVGEAVDYLGCAGTVLVISLFNGGDNLGQIAWCAPVTEPVKKTKDLMEMLDNCIKSIGGGKSSDAGLRTLSATPVPNSVYTEARNRLAIVVKMFESQTLWTEAYYGAKLTANENLKVLAGYLESNIASLKPIDDATASELLKTMSGYGMASVDIENFILRWNRSIKGLAAGVMQSNEQYPDIINWNQVKQYSNTLIEAKNEAKDKGFDNIVGLYENTLLSINDLIIADNDAVCASVTIQFNQQLAMTREAFEGTLEIFNGHPTDGMKQLAVDIEITDENGVPSNGLFEIQAKTLSNLSDVTGTGQIAAQEKGSVQFIFIPESAAAPKEPKVYRFGGTVTYWDPYAQAIVKLPLTQVPITVNPAPNLTLHYFMQRNILGDDALTSPEIEPSVPAELAVMVENQGYGPAVNMTISSSQPKITDNEKGLDIDFELIGSNFQGQPKKLGTTNINFGTIPALQTRIGQWYFTSSLLGKFVSYEAKVVHANSYGNPDLSLVKEVKLHELTKSIRLYEDDEDGVGDFLVNDIFDIDDQPDIIYFSQGNRTAKVNAAKSGSFSASVQPPSFVNKLTVLPSDTGFNYVKLEDPGNRLYDLVSVTRNDGQVIPIENAWLTYVTLPVSRSPVYENKFHFVDRFTGTAAVNYTVVWKPKNTNVLKVDSIYNAPSGTSVVQLKKLKVVFNKRIDAASFTVADLKLTLQGGPNLINSSVKISQLDTTTYEVDLSEVTNGNGLYLFTAQAAEITDVYGITGTAGRQVSWSQFIDVPAVEAFKGIPDSHVASKFDGIGVLFNLPIDMTTVIPARFSIKKNGTVLNGKLVIDSVSKDHKLFYLSGLKDLLVQNGKYELVVDLPNIKAESQKAGLKQQSVMLTVDNTGPVLVSLEKLAAGGIDNQHIPIVKMEFDEDAIGFNVAAIQLTRNGEVLPLRIDQLSNTDLKLWSAGNFGILTYPDGNYTLKVNLAGVKDAGGNAGIGSKSVSWIVNRTASIAITKLAVKPDLGYSDTDGITSGTAMTVSFHLDNAAEKVTISQTDKSGEATLTTINKVAAGEVAIPVALLPGGSMGIKVTAADKNGITTSQEKAMFIDRTALTGKWAMASGQTLTRQPDTLDVVFSSRLLDQKLLLNAIQLTRNGVVLPKVSLRSAALNDTLYQVTGLRGASTLEGNYQVILDTRLLSKYTSGKTGDATAIANWAVMFPNEAPVANAGQDIEVKSSGLVKLDGSGSSDPDQDAITYSWTAPDGIILTGGNTATPSFTATMDQNGKTFLFLLLVSDGKSFHTDVVNVSMNYPPLAFQPIPEKAYGDADFELIATSGQGTVSYALTAQGIVSIEKNKVHIIKPGTVSITATDGKTTLKQTLILKKAVLKVTAQDVARNYGAPNPAFKLSYEGFVNGDDLAKLITAPVASSTVSNLTTAGSYPITVTGGSSDYYNFSYVTGKITINKVGQTISFSPLAAKVYGDPVFELTASSTSGLPVTYTSSDPAIALVQNSNQIKILKAGIVTISAQQAGDLNYTQAAGLQQDLVIGKANLTIQADHKSRVYGAENPVLTASYTGFVNGDDAARLQSPPRITTLAGLTSNVGVYPITVEGGSSDSYSMRYVNGNLTVDKASQAIVFQDIPLLQRRGKVYTVDVKSNSGLPVQLMLNDTLVAVLNGTTLGPLRVGTGKITASQPGDGNYLPATTVVKDFRVTDDNNAVVRVHPAVSPDGDGINDFLIIEGVADYPDNHVAVVTRNGAKVFETSGYDNKSKVFSGKNASGDNLPEGTYFYVLEYKENGKTQRQTGYFVIKY
ncbi:MAG: MBG domain-containing protein [Bacteroidota bacterium]